MVFLDARDYEAFLEIFRHTLVRFRWVCHAYCLMPNHYHLLVETPEAGLGRGMRHLNGSYAQRFNRRYDHVGHVFQGPYDAVLVEGERHFLELSRYIVLNPVRAGLCGQPGDWAWSSYRSALGGAQLEQLAVSDFVLAQFSEDAERARQRYGEFVRERIARNGLGSGPGPV